MSYSIDFTEPEDDIFDYSLLEEDEDDTDLSQECPYCQGSFCDWCV